MGGELVPRKNEKIQEWIEPERQVQPARPYLREQPPPLMHYPPIAPEPAPPPVQNFYYVSSVEEREDTRSGARAILDDLARPVVMLIWGAVAVGIYFTGWWMSAAGFAQIGIALFLTFFLTAPHARKYLMFLAAVLLAWAFAASLHRTSPAAPAAPVASDANVPPATSPLTVKRHKTHPHMEVKDAH